VRISRFPLGSLGTKCHLDVAPVDWRREYYKGEGGGFPPSLGRDEFCESELLMVRPNTKNVPTMN
jgi:hypothetical protein